MAMNNCDNCGQPVKDHSADDIAACLRALTERDRGK